MVEYLKTDNRGKLVYCKTEENADYVVVPKNEYYGLRNALRIVHDRALQQVDKSKVDEHGYRLLRCDSDRDILL